MRQHAPVKTKPLEKDILGTRKYTAPATDVPTNTDY
jgi:hypothetical protein